NVTSVDLSDYVTIGKTGFNITTEYSFNGAALTGSVAQISENGEFAYGVKVSAIPFNKYSLFDVPAFDPIIVTGKVTRAEAEVLPTIIDKSTVYDKIFGGWTGANWGIYAGLDTECRYNDQPNPATEIKWNLGQGYCTDDDTNVEYMFLHMMEVYGVNDVVYEDMPEEWVTHCQNYVWCGNETARNLMGSGLLPPYTGSKQYNQNWGAIDAQIESEIFGMIAPGMPENAYTRTVWWLKSVGDGNALENAAYYAMLCSNAFIQSDVMESLATVSSKILLYSEGRAQSAVDIVNFVVNSYRQKETQYLTDREIWRQTRQEIYDKYWNGSCVDANMNFALTVMALVYGQNDFEETARIAVIAGCDNDCNAATACTIVGMANGFNGLPENLKEKSGYNYLNSRRPGLTDDTFDNITKRIMAQADEVILSQGGEVNENSYSVLDGAFEPKNYVAAEYTRNITTNESTWSQNGFAKFYNSDLQGKIGFVAKQGGAKLTCEFKGTSIGISGALCPDGGTIEIFVDGVSYGVATMKTDRADGANGSVSMCYGQTLKKIRELTNETHVLEIVALEEGKQYPIEYITAECTEEEYYSNLPQNVNYARLKSATPICSVTTPGVGAGGSPVLSVINDGKYFTDFGNLKQQYDTFLGFDNDGNLIDKPFDDYFGYQFDRTFTFGKIVFQEGGHWGGGGWFANGDVRVEVLIDGVWTNVEYSLDKTYPNGNTLDVFGSFGEFYTFTLSRQVQGTGIRVIGTPGGYQKLASCAEMEVYAFKGDEK
ncbi:MAG: ADP-ribosylglycohydrolase family protein, partial [Candidatus Neoclostridium sp.]